MEAWIFNPPSSSVLPQHPGQGPRSPNLVQGVWSSPGGTAVQDVLTERMNDWICTERESVRLEMTVAERLHEIMG